MAYFECALFDERSICSLFSSYFPVGYFDVVAAAVVLVVFLLGISRILIFIDLKRRLTFVRQITYIYTASYCAIAYVYQIAMTDMETLFIYDV